ncbi:hypothetical protein [Labilibaculum antarcticum]|nr:hypothetical protein [Labilibaculum antarcticum]
MQKKGIGNGMFPLNKKGVDSIVMWIAHLSKTSTSDGDDGFKKL